MKPKDDLRLVLTDHWFDEIKSGRKTHEYRLAKPYWVKRIVMGECDRTTILSICSHFPRLTCLELTGFVCTFKRVTFQRAYRKNAETMSFNIRSVRVVNGKNTDLAVDVAVFDIELGQKIKNLTK